MTRRKVKDVRDIRDDLKERIAGIDGRRDNLMRALKDLDLEREVLTRTLEFETRRFSVQGAPISAAEALELRSAHGGIPRVVSAGFQRRPPIADFIDDLLARQPLTKDELRAKAEEAGYFQGDESAGRVMHATIMNLDRHGRIRLRPDGKYENAPEREAQGRLVEG